MFENLLDPSKMVDNAVNDWLKKNWWLLAILATGIIFITWIILK